MEDRIVPILATTRVLQSDGKSIGLSREGRDIRAFRFGTGTTRVSLIGGCHADEPVGPRLLRHLCAYLSTLPPNDPLIEQYDWWIVPHVNPDGEAVNSAWYDGDDVIYDFGRYSRHVVRELPGDDIEFGFPKGEDDHDGRPAPRAVYDWWRTSTDAFALHASLHSTGFAAGPWFLIEEAWKDRCELLKERCADRVTALGYVLHDVERNGEKGFVRLGRGFTTRPDSRYMRKHFLELGDEETASRFRPSSMETIRSLGGDPLTLVSEMPLFITPGVGEELGPPDPVLELWKERRVRWRAAAQTEERAAAVAREAQEAGLRAMPVRDQMILQWTFIVAGLEQVMIP